MFNIFLEEFDNGSEGIIVGDNIKIECSAHKMFTAVGNKELAW